MGEQVPHLLYWASWVALSPAAKLYITDSHQACTSVHTLNPQIVAFNIPWSACKANAKLPHVYLLSWRSIGNAVKRKWQQQEKIHFFRSFDWLWLALRLSLFSFACWQGWEFGCRVCVVHVAPIMSSSLKKCYIFASTASELSAFNWTVGT